MAAILRHNHAHLLSSAFDPTIPFSVTCRYCDCDSPDNPAEAAELGWIEIEYDDGPLWNYLGVCRECRFEHDLISLPLTAIPPQGGGK